MSTNKSASPRKQKGTRERKRPADFTPPSCGKKQKDRSEEDISEDICQVCDTPIVEYSSTTEGEEAVFCEGQCNAWIHRKCSGLTSELFDIVSKLNEPFRCCYCMLPHQRNEINTLKHLVESLTVKISSLESKTVETSTIVNPQPPPNQTPKDTQFQSTSNPIQSSDSTCQHKYIAPTFKKPATPDDKTQNDRKFNIVVYGIDECSKGTPKNERLNHDLDKVTSIITKGENSISPLSIRDLVRLGKYHEQLKQPRPLLVKLNRSIDASALLLKARSLPKTIRIKPDISQADRLVESLLLKERWSLIQNSIDRKVIKIRSNKIFVHKKLHGQVINSTFVLSQSHQLIPMDSSSS